MSRVTGLCLFGLLIFGFFVSAQEDCSKAHYTYDPTWLCVEEINPVYDAYGQFYLWEGEYGAYPKWHVVVKDISTSGEHNVELECWHDTWEGPVSYIYTHQFDVLQDPAWTWTHCLNIHSTFELYATTSVPEVGYASWDPVWDASGCPNIYYADYDGGVPSTPKVYLNPFWGSAKQSPSQQSALVSSSKGASEAARISAGSKVFSAAKRSTSRVSSVLSRVRSYFRQRAFKR